jgi:hypothetical protein
MLGMHLLRRYGFNEQNRQILGTRSASHIIQEPSGHVKRRKQAFPKDARRGINTRKDPVENTGSQEGNYSDVDLLGLFDQAILARISHQLNPGVQP